ncbi:MAG: response regulator [Desulfobacterales bacterium]
MKTALVVDNHPLFLTFLESLLTRQGLRVRTAEDGLAALQMLQQELPDIVFSDLIMPNIGGDRLCRLIRRIPQYQSVYLVLVTALAPELNVPRRPPFGVDAVIAKGPFERMLPHVMRVLAQLDLPAERRGRELVFGLDAALPRQVSQELLADKRHYERLLSSISEGICELTAEGTIVYVNPVAREFFNRPPEKLISANISELFENSEREAIQGVLEQVRYLGRPIRPSFAFHLGQRQIELDIVPQDDRAVSRVFVILHDVTSRKRHESRLQEARKMEAVGTLAAGIAHDFNNILMAIQGNASLLLLEMGENDPRYPRLKTIESHIETASRVTRHLLGYARMGRYQVRHLKLNRLIGETAATFARARRDIELNCRLTQETTCIEADAGQIQQALFSLLVTAGNTMPQGGTLTILTERVNHHRIPASIADPSPGDYIYCRLSDTGQGMEASVRERIFEPFSAHDHSSPDNPLGLAAAQGSITGHGGYIQVQSQPGEGTTFHLFLPASIRDGLEAPTCRMREEPVAEETESTVPQGHTILLIDDEAVILDVGQAMLKSLNHRVITAADGKSAEEALKKWRQEIRLVLMDMTLPDINGATLYPKLKSIKPDINVIVISGYTLDESIAKLLSKGCCGFIQKPFSLQVLAAEIESVLG